MRIEVKPGNYILAVSGGVDSMVLLDLLSNLPGLEIVVAHFDHGIRPESSKDERFVRRAVTKYGLAYESGSLGLGARASEAAARGARYDFLASVKAKHQADYIITAHHQDDLIETALINLLRGTGRRGLYAISANPKVLRPLLGHSKKQILRYAKQHNIEWAEDPTNSQEDYLRNYLRINIMPKLTASQRGQIISNSDKVAKIDGLIQHGLTDIESMIFSGNELDRSLFAALPTEIGNELLLKRFRSLDVLDIDKRTITRINANIRTGRQSQEYPVKDGLKLKLTDKAALFTR